MPQFPDVYSLNDPTSFAYSTARSRWPKIITQSKQDVLAHARKSEDAELKKQSETIVEGIELLLQEIEEGASIREFTKSEVALIPSLQSYNDVLATMKEKSTWLSGPWLFTECYLYRVLDLIVKSQSKWVNFDIFEVLKRDTFKSSKFGIYELAIRYKKLSEELKKTAQVEIEKLRILFEEFIDISLWGNATDLSLLANATLEDIQSRQGKEAREKSAKNIIANDLPEAWKRLVAVPFEERRIDFVLDNAGFEFYTDLSLSLFLLDAKLVKTVVFHCKTRPWMVSDTMVKDYKLFLQDMRNTEWFPDHQEELEYFASSIEHYHDTEQFQLTDSEFWTSALDYSCLSPHEIKYGGAELYKYFQNSTVVIVKGDLNYRKLTGDRKWPKTTPFVDAIDQLATSDIHILALRTCKADVCVGLPEGLEEKLIAFWKQQGNELGELWCSSGKWAVISYSAGNTSTK
ncbi:hypothetical protein PMKS-004071 [Pichia membranifaciens]|uniref:Sugar phosphate phosphatase n=1 Tax=Pichia membranifaciens TaxID=4926 RepID=A0A1Q2YM30_9ASCO|nr:hypothetical protein PMKS-004071 [Pichia membranifaciens]